MKNIVISCIYFISLSLFFINNCIAQSTCNQFYADTLRGCSPLKVTIKRCPNVEPVNSVIFYNFGNGFQTDSTFIYTQSALQTVEMRWETFSFILPINLEIFEPKQPIFSVAACSGKKIKLTISDNYYEKFIVSVPNHKNDTLSRNSSKIYTLSNDGIFPITVIGKFYYNASDSTQGFSGGNCGTKTIMTSVYSQIPAPIFDSLVAFRGDSLQLNFKLAAGIEYFVEEKKNNTAYQLIQSLTDISIKISLFNKSIKDTTYCYRIVAKDVCSNSLIYSQEICTSNLNIKVSNLLHEISWNQYLGKNFNNYQIYKNNKLFKQLSVLSQINSRDIEVACGKSYCYKIKIASNSNKSFFIGYDTCVQAINIFTPIKVKNPLISVINNKIEVNFQVIGSYDSLFLLKSEQNKGFVKSYISSTKYIDNIVQPNDSTYRYLIYYKDSCGNASALSDTLSPILLKVERQNNDNILVWSHYKTFVGNFIYQIEYLDENLEPYRLSNEIPSSVNKFTDLFSTFDKDIMRYRIKVISKNTNQVSYSNNIEVEKDFQLFIPNAFSPNDDGLNDLFEIKAFSLKNFKMSIFDKWSNLVFQSSDINLQWDGTFRNSPAPVGSYAYLIEAESFSGEKIQKRGFIMLVR